MSLITNPPTTLSHLVTSYKLKQESAKKFPLFTLLQYVHCTSKMVVNSFETNRLNAHQYLLQFTT